MQGILEILFHLLKVEILIFENGQLAHFSAGEGHGGATRFVNRQISTQVERGGPVSVIVQVVVDDSGITVQVLLQNIVIFGIVHLLQRDVGTTHICGRHNGHFQLSVAHQPFAIDYLRRILVRGELIIFDGLCEQCG